MKRIIGSKLMFKAFEVDEELYKTLMNLTPALREAALEFLWRKGVIKEGGG